MTKQGHQMITTTLRAEEVNLLADLADRVGDGRPAVTGISRTPVSRAAVMRALLRYGLEHKEEFMTWLEGASER